MTFREAVEMEQKGKSMMNENPSYGLWLIEEVEAYRDIRYFESICFSCRHLEECPWAPDPQEGEPVESCNLYDGCRLKF